ncbi:hypothetical protein R5R35_007728 [Gryllus longicercus]|uniref:Mpv17-like protein 2 n=1 Tax=Gryllus longicercus TaxID=2509291 RepID=A0AAN9VAI3_9ORTH
MHYARYIFRILQSKAVAQCHYVGRVLFSKHLLLTNVGISSFSSALGDFIEQQYEIVQNEKRKWDKMRTYNMTVSGITVGILCHYTYYYLDILYPGRTLRNIIKKVLIDQIVCSPLCIGLFFGTLAVLEKSDWDTYKDEVIEKGWRLYFAEWMVWPPAQLVNFYIVPPKFRVLYDNLISLGFDIYTSYIKHEVDSKEN